MGVNDPCPFCKAKFLNVSWAKVYQGDTCGVSVAHYHCTCDHCATEFIVLSNGTIITPEPA